jgi:hypothetical protein
MMLNAEMHAQDCRVKLFCCTELRIAVMMRVLINT